MPHRSRLGLCFYRALPRTTQSQECSRATQKPKTKMKRKRRQRRRIPNSRAHVLRHPNEVLLCLCAIVHVMEYPCLPLLIASITHLNTASSRLTPWLIGSLLSVSSSSSSRRSKVPKRLAGVPCPRPASPSSPVPVSACLQSASSSGPISSGRSAASAPPPPALSATSNRSPGESGPERRHACPAATVASAPMIVQRTAAPQTACSTAPASVGLPQAAER